MAVEAKVAAILTNTTAAISAGSDHGISVDDTGTISNLVSVTDPVSGEHLGDVTVEKVKVRVVSVKPRVSVVRVTDTYRNNDTAYLKSITEDPDMADWRNILVSKGDHVEIGPAIDLW